MKSKIKEMKQQQKERAEEIRALKSQRKPMRGYVPGLEHAQYVYRINHIVYCLLRGRKPEEIENRWRDPDDYTHKNVWTQAKNKIEEIYKEFDMQADKELVGYEAIRANSK